MELNKIMKWIPVVAAGVVAVVQAIGEQKEANRINNMDERIARLENKEES